MSTKTHLEFMLDRLANKLEFIVSERVGVVSLSQKDGCLTPCSEIRLKGDLSAHEKATAFSSAHIRGTCYDGPYDTGLNGEIVQGFIRATDGELEVTFMVPVSRFLSFSLETNFATSSEVRVVVWPLEDLSAWDGESVLQLREIEVLSVSSAEKRGQAS
jgi:hypothetical protein